MYRLEFDPLDSGRVHGVITLLSCVVCRSAVCAVLACPQRGCARCWGCLSVGMRRRSPRAWRCDGYSAVASSGDTVSLAGSWVFSPASSGSEVPQRVCAVLASCSRGQLLSS